MSGRTSILWIICGAGRGVGKTHLAHRLCQVLPESVCAKLGHGRRKPAGRPHFFNTPRELQAFLDAQRPRRRHVVVESNALAARRDAGVVIYLAPPAGRKIDARADAESLRSAATVRVEPRATRRQWSRALSGALPEPAPRRAVLDVLEDQRHFNAGGGSDGNGAAPVDVPALSARAKLWLEAGPRGASRGGEHVLGRGLAALLAGVEATGSLTKAAAGADMSYRYAWHLVRQAEEHLGQPMVVASSGGRRGGGSVLSPVGRGLLSVFETLNADVAAFAARRLDELMREPR